MGCEFQSVLSLPPRWEEGTFLSKNGGLLFNISGQPNLQTSSGCNGLTVTPETGGNLYLSINAHHIPQVSAVNIQLLESETHTLKSLAFRINKHLVTLEQRSSVDPCQEIRGMKQHEMKHWIGSPDNEFYQLLGKSVLKI